ncbi:pseudoazurin [Paracoccus sulfuroxidans]|uniref:Pseudoazurin n=1 Tax=Paracoccus sulfuroxidans TaxID=384678 RepID=A0A562NV17_9RHOB|nr:pseudoazurin [Paracoccus sulfuroxidans]TWI35931.1 pseudoazurin [Paracoccus sulfuroxidans]
MKHAALALFLMASPALAEVHEVKMLNRNDQGSMIYEPQFLRIAPGDSVRFLPTQPGHNAATVEGMLPEGAEPFRSKINQEFEVTFDVPGTYGIKCSPHFAMGMVMLVQVGDGAISPIPEGLPKRASERFVEIAAAAKD